MQLARSSALAIVAALLATVAPRIVRADAPGDHADVTTTWYEEARQGGKGGLSVVSPQAAVGVDAGEHTTLNLNYTADAVTGATATVYSVDAVSSATRFSDLRQEGSASLDFHGQRSSLNGGASVGTERDYVSFTIFGGGSIDLPGKNTNLALTYIHNFDQVCDKDNSTITSPLEARALTGADPCTKSWARGVNTPGETLWKPVAIDTAQVTLTQNISPTMNLQLSAFGQLVDGFQSNPYRRVRVGDVEPQENIPNSRARASLTARINKFLPSLHSALHFDVRAYSDTWGVNSGTVELAYSQYASKNLLLRLHARFYQQTAATFFKDAFFYQTESTAGAYFTGDRELSPVRNGMIGAKMSVLSVGSDDQKVWHLFKKLTFNLNVDVLMLHELAAEDPTTNLAGRDSQFLTSASLFNAFVLQLGLLAIF